VTGFRGEREKSTSQLPKTIAKKQVRATMQGGSKGGGAGDYWEVKRGKTCAVPVAPHWEGQQKERLKEGRVMPPWAKASQETYLRRAEEAETPPPTLK